MLLWGHKGNIGMQYFMLYNLHQVLELLCAPNLKSTTHSQCHTLMDSFLRLNENRSTNQIILSLSKKRK